MIATLILALLAEGANSPGQFFFGIFALMAVWVLWITGLLSLPFMGKISGYVINRRQWDDA